MRIQIKDLSSGEIYDIGENGASIGRESARNDIAILDEAISKSHARIFNQDNQWFLEDLNSSNGCFVNGQKLKAPFPLKAKTTFALSQRNFVVLAMDATTEIESNKPNFYGPGSSESSHLSQPVPIPLSSDAIKPIEDSDELEPSEFWLEVCASLIYLIPKAIFRPRNFIREGLMTPRWHARERLELLFVLLPATLLIVAIYPVCEWIALLLKNASTDNGSLTRWAAITCAAIGSSIFLSFLWHPLVQRIIEVLGGSSDEESRTNYLFSLFIISAFISLSSSISYLLNSLSHPIFPLITPLLILIGTIIMSYFIIAWNRHFGLNKPARYLVSILSVFIILLATVNFGTSVQASVNQLFPVEKATQKPDALNQKRLRPKVTSGSEKTATATKTKQQGVRPTKAVVQPKNTDVEKFKQRVEPKDKEITAFEQFIEKRNAIEARIKSDPNLIRDKKVLRPYSRIWKKTYDLRDKYRKKKGPRWQKERIFSRQKDADIFEATRKDVDALHKYLFKN